MGGYLEYRGGCSVPWGDIMINVGGYLEYRGGCSVSQVIVFVDIFLQIHVQWPFERRSQIVNCSEMLSWKFGLTIVTLIGNVSLIQWNDRFSHPCNLIGPLTFFQTLEDCDQFRIANGTSPFSPHHKGHRSNNKDSCSKSKIKHRDFDHVWETWKLFLPWSCKCENDCTVSAECRLQVDPQRVHKEM